MSLYKKNSWNFPCVSISIISFWQVYVFHFSKLTATIIWYRLWLQVIIAVRKKGLTGRRLHIVIYTRNSTTYSVIFCYNLDCIWNFQTHSMKKVRTTESKDIYQQISLLCIPLNVLKHLYKTVWFILPL